MRVHLGAPLPLAEGERMTDAAIDGLVGQIVAFRVADHVRDCTVIGARRDGNGVRVMIAADLPDAVITDPNATAAMSVDTPHP